LRNACLLPRLSCLLPPVARRFTTPQAFGYGRSTATDLGSDQEVVTPNSFYRKSDCETAIIEGKFTDFNDLQKITKMP
ncbi:MAG: hypothetical protein J7641_13540, partial [Cyanobacteria bacterium SID2]|nr:hypothetical protein [Cyanobacteria bacterium SID2]